MKALLCSEWGGPETLAVADVPDPVPAPGEALIRVHAAGVNFPDGLIIQNKYQFKPPLPFIPGNECAGIVEAVGPGVSSVKVGERVIALPRIGGFAELLACPAQSLFAIPDGLDFVTAAAFLMTYSTSYHALADRGALKPGETLLVLGAAGGVGLAAVEIGKALGSRVIAAASTPEKLAVCREHGADILIDYTAENLREALDRHTGGKGVDVTYDPVGGAFTEIALRASAWRGRLLIVGFANGEIPRLPANLALLKGASVVGVYWGRYMNTEPDNFRRDIAVLMGWLARGLLRPRIAGTYSLARGAEAIAALLERRVIGKLVITPAER